MCCPSIDLTNTCLNASGKHATWTRRLLLVLLPFAWCEVGAGAASFQLHHSFPLRAGKLDILLPADVVCM